MKTTGSKALTPWERQAVRAHRELFASLMTLDEAVLLGGIDEFSRKAEAGEKDAEGAAHLMRYIAMKRGLLPDEDRSPYEWIEYMLSLPDECQTMTKQKAKATRPEWFSDCVYCRGEVDPTEGKYVIRTNVDLPGMVACAHIACADKALAEARRGRTVPEVSPHLALVHQSVVE